jgi:multidrug efflux pump subunit AcrA (membrane-fusion protein)
MKKYFFHFYIIFILFLAACTPVVAERSAPVLAQPVSVKADTAFVTRGAVERMEQYRSFVRVKSEGLFFTDTGLRFGEYFIMSGERVVRGQLLAKLDTEWIEEQIEEQEERLERLRREQYFEAESLALDIDIARAEYVVLMRFADINEQTLEAAERKKFEIERAEINLAQTLERQALTYSHAVVYMNELKERLPKAELRAPYDGVITLRVPKSPGEHVEAFANLVYISDETDYFLEYVGDESISPARGSVIHAVYGDTIYEMERVTLTRQEALFYNARMMTSPLRLITVDPDAVLPPPGTFLTLRIYAGVAEDALRIPANALFSDAELGHYVYRMEQGSKIPVPVEVGIVTDIFIEIEYGLAEGDEVLVH